MNIVLEISRSSVRPKDSGPCLRRNLLCVISLLSLVIWLWLWHWLKAFHPCIHDPRPEMIHVLHHSKRLNMAQAAGYYSLSRQTPSQRPPSNPNVDVFHPQTPCKCFQTPRSLVPQLHAAYNYLPARAARACSRSLALYLREAVSRYPQGACAGMLQGGRGCETYLSSFSIRSTWVRIMRRQQ